MTAPTEPSTRTVATHDGTFHCDEVLAVHMLTNHVPQFRSASVVRSRDPAVLSGADIVVDVGAVYDPATHRYDHHQRGFTSTFSGEPAPVPLPASGKRVRGATKLSSAGLVYKHFGREVIASVVAAGGLDALSDEDVDRVFHKVYDSFMEAVDAIDNGVSMYDTDARPRYESSTDLGSRVMRCNADWFEKMPDQDKNFCKAVQLAGTELDECIVRVARSWLPARSIIARAYAARKEEHASGQIMVMREWAPWKDHLYELEAETTDEKEKLLYVVYQDMTGKSWRVQCVPVAKASFESRRPLPQAWRGVRDDELSQTSGIDGCVFVHASGFIGGNATFEGAMKMAEKALSC